MFLEERVILICLCAAAFAIFICSAIVIDTTSRYGAAHGEREKALQSCLSLEESEVTTVQCPPKQELIKKIKESEKISSRIEQLMGGGCVSIIVAMLEFGACIYFIFVSDVDFFYYIIFGVIIFMLLLVGFCVVLTGGTRGVNAPKVPEKMAPALPAHNFDFNESLTSTSSTVDPNLRGATTDSTKKPTKEFDSAWSRKLTALLVFTGINMGLLMIIGFILFILCKCIPWRRSRRKVKTSEVGSKPSSKKGSKEDLKEDPGKEKLTLKEAMALAYSNKEKPEPEKEELKKQPKSSTGAKEKDMKIVVNGESIQDNRVVIQSERKPPEKRQSTVGGENKRKKSTDVKRKSLERGSDKRSAGSRTSGPKRTGSLKPRSRTVSTSSNKGKKQGHH